MALGYLWMTVAMPLPWAVLGHSDGGGYALQYVTSHPEAVQAVIFDCPCWDADLTDRTGCLRLPAGWMHWGSVPMPTGAASSRPSQAG